MTSRKRNRRIGGTATRRASPGHRRTQPAILRPAAHPSALTVPFRTDVLHLGPPRKPRSLRARRNRRDVGGCVRAGGYCQGVKRGFRYCLYPTDQQRALSDGMLVQRFAPGPMASGLSGARSRTAARVPAWGWLAAQDAEWGTLVRSFPTQNTTLDGAVITILRVRQHLHHHGVDIRSPASVSATSSWMTPLYSGCSIPLRPVRLPRPTDRPAMDTAPPRSWRGHGLLQRPRRDEELGDGLRSVPAHRRSPGRWAS